MAPSSSKAGSRCSSSTQRSPILSGVQSQQLQRQQQQRMHQDVRRQLLQASSKTASGSKGGAGGCRGGGTAAAPTASSCPAGACDQLSKRVVQQQPQARENSHSNSNKRLVKESKWQGAYVPSCGVLQPQAAHQRPTGSRNTGTPSATAAMHGAALAAAAATSTPAAPQSGTTPLTAAAATATAALAAATAAPETKAAPAATAAARTTATAAAVLAPPAASTPAAAASAAALLLAGSRPVTAVWRQEEPNGRRRVASAHAGDSGLRKGPPLGQRQQQQQRRPQQQTGGGMSLLSRVQAWFAGGDRGSAAASAQTKKEHAAGAAAGAACPAAVFHSFSRSTLRRSNTTCSSIQTSAIAAAAAQRSHVAALLSSTAVPEEAPSAETGGSLRLSSLPSGFTYPPRVPVLQQPWAPTAGSSVLLAAGSSSSSPSTTGGAAAAAASMSCAAGYSAESLCLQSPWGALASKMEPQQQQRAAFSGSVLLDMPPHQQLVSVTREDAALQQVPPLLHGRLQQQRQEHDEGQEGEEQQRKQREQAQLMQQFLQQQQERYATVRQASLSNDLSHGQGYVTFAHAAAAAARFHMYGAAGEAAAVPAVRSRPSSVGAAARRAAPVAAAAAAAGYVSESLEARETAGTVKRTDPAPSGAVGEGALATDARAEAAAAFPGAAESDVSAEEEKETEEKTAELPGGEDGKPLVCFSEDEKLAAAAAAVPAGVQASSSSETISSDNGSSGEGASKNTRQMYRSSGTRGTEKSSGHRSINGKGNKSRGKGVESKAEVGAAGVGAPEECRERLERAEAEGKAAAMKVVSSGKKFAAAAACVAKKKHPSQKLKTARWRVQQEDTQDQHQQPKLQQPHQQMEQQKNQRKPHGSKVYVQQQRQQLLPSVTQEGDDAGIVLQYQKPQGEHRHHCGLQQRVDEGEEGKEGEQEEAALTRQLLVLRPAEKKREAVQQQQRQVEEQQERYGLLQEASEQQQQQGATGEEQQIETAANEEEAESGKCGVLKTREQQREKEVVITAAAAGATEEEEGEDRIRAAAEGAAAEEAATASGDAGKERAATPVTYETAAEGTRGGEEAAAEQAEGDTRVLEVNAAIVSGARGLAAETATANAADGARAGGAAANAEVTEDAEAEGDGATATAAALRPDDRNDTERIGAAENEEDAMMLPFGQAYPEGILKGCKKIYELDEELQHERERIVQVLLIHDTPDVYLLPHLLTAAQCRHIIDLCATRWRKSRTSKGLADAPPSEYSSTESRTRTSHSARLRPAETPVVAAVEEVAAAFAGCSVECLEPLAVVKYEEGESFKEHHDGAFRPVTLLIYLNDVEEGGETEFPYLHLKLTPTQGWGVMWRNAMPECQTLGNSSESSSCSRRMCIDPRVLHAGLPPRKGGPKYVVNCFFNENPIRQAIAQAEAAAAQAAAAAAAAHEKEASEGAEARKAREGRTPEAAEDSRTATTGGAEPLPRAASPLLRNRTAAAASEEGRRLGQQPGYRTCNSFETTTTSTVASTPSDGRQPSAAFLLRQQQQVGGLQHGYGVVQQEQHQGVSSLSSQAQQQQQRLLQENWGSCQSLCSRIENPVRSAGSDHPGRYAVQHQQERKTTLVEIRGPKTAVAGSAVSAMASGSSVADIRNPLFAATAAARRGGAGVSGLQQHPQLARRGTQRHVAASPSRLVYGAAGSVRASSSGALFSTNGASLPSSSSSRALEDAQTAGIQAINNSGFSPCSMQAASRVQPPSSSGAAASKILHAELKTIPSASSNAYRQGFQGSVPTGSISSNIQRTRVGQTASCLQASGKIIQAFSNSSTYVQHGLTTGKSLAAPARLFHNGGARSEGMAGGYSTAAVGCYQQQVSREISAARGVRGSSLCRAGGVPAAGAAAHYGGRNGSSIFYPGATLAGASMTAAQSTAAGVGRGLDIFGGHRPLNTQLCAGGGGQEAFNPFNLQGNNNFFSSAPAFMMVFGPDGVPQMKPLTQQQIEEGVGKHLLHEAIKNFKP